MDRIRVKGPPYECAWVAETSRNRQHWAYTPVKPRVTHGKILHLSEFYLGFEIWGEAIIDNVAVGVDVGVACTPYCAKCKNWHFMIWLSLERVNFNPCMISAGIIKATFVLSLAILLGREASPLPPPVDRTLKCVPLFDLFEIRPFQFEWLFIGPDRPYFIHFQFTNERILKYSDN